MSSTSSSHHSPKELLSFPFVLCLLLYSVLVFLFFVDLSAGRFVARDEAFYLYAGKLVERYAAIPYRDFFYPQTPLAPLLYGYWMKWQGFSWMAGRELSAVFAALLGGIMFLFCKKQAGLFASCLCAFAYPFSNFTYPWLTTGKAYAMSAFFLVAAILLLLEQRERNGQKYFPLMIAGLLFAFSINTRLYVGGLLPLLLFFLGGRHILAQAFFFCLGMAIGLSPNLPLLINDFPSYFFNNLGYHLARRNDGEIVEAAKRVKILSILFGMIPSQQFHSLLFPVCAWGAVLAFGAGIWHKLKKQTLSYSFFFACSGIALSAISFLPTPVYIQYFCLSFPLLLLASIFFVVEWRAKISQKSCRCIFSCVALGIFLLATFHQFQTDYVNFTQTGRGVIGIGNRQNARTWRLGPVEQMAGRIDKEALQDEEIITSWPGFFVSTKKAKVAAGYENHFGLYIGDDLSPKDRARYHIRSWSDMEEDIRARKTRLVVIENRFLQRKLLEAIQDAGYQQIDQIEQFHLFGIPSPFDKRILARH